jgi:hypothetical protein
MISPIIFGLGNSPEGAKTATTPVLLEVEI